MGQAAIPENEVKDIQDQIKVHGNRMMLNEREDLAQDDAISVLLRHLWADSLA